ncbi:hypothetical protein WOLCODRAFT_139305 [Wolfiporia cocos MD-104 SS10]|uniref:Uncharacterized protein n=1 Tax=Wolfiporia cocos (strain MD-104) TaxID=742152 RepID=A0A2H3JTI9_WOLCO|nr:hypothetical protein WOLCODRAFT_139305 [Wolfiporia cocos MD-104 SS10]
MSSAIPTRRVTRATRTTVIRDKENATARTTRTSTRAKVPSTANAIENAKPVVTTRVTASTVATRAKAVAVAASKTEQTKRKREALGEVPKPPENRPAKPVNAGPGMSAMKGKTRGQDSKDAKEVKEKFDGVVIKKNTTTTTTSAPRAPLRTVSGAPPSGSITSTARRTRSTTAQQQKQQQLEQVQEEEEPEQQDRMAIDSEPPAPVPAPKRFVAAREAAVATRPSVVARQPVAAPRANAAREIPVATGRHTTREPVVAPVAHAAPVATRPPALREPLVAARPTATRTHTPKRAAPRQPRRYEEDEEENRAFKKRRTSSEVPEEAVAEAEEVVGRAATPEVDPQRSHWDDLDAEDADDPLMVSEYVVEIFEYLKEVEQTTMPNPRYMEYQKDLTWEMRGILTDWLIQVHSRFKLLPETLFLCINIIDRFCSTRFVSLKKLQLMGVVAMFIAAKVEEIMAPSVQNFVFCTEAGYTEAEILAAERYMLQSLDYNMSYPNPIHFLRRASKADDYNLQVRTIAKYFIEIQVVEWRLIAAPPSLLAAAAIWLARIVLGFPDWTPNLAHYSSYPESAIVPTANLMLNYVLKPIKHESFFKKYASKRFMKASVFVREWALERWDEGTNVALAAVLSELKALIREQRAREEELLAEQQALEEAEAVAVARKGIHYGV